VTFLIFEEGKAGGLCVLDIFCGSFPATSFVGPFKVELVRGATVWDVVDDSAKRGGGDEDEFDDAEEEYKETLLSFKIGVTTFCFAFLASDIELRAVLSVSTSRPLRSSSKATARPDRPDLLRNCSL